ncbi:hypothetical protein CYMTET_54061 [Cymbomonas tetramitiformis]|uniref:WRC domain-containing protein n=1 Tax=Cymbomonas tetramitiformis TaxID=36881 RepID=A0AAE0BH43_9CHLO|nr:hypothetical protein CYMTET_54061 [Cymbomonas tetramitiformis]
MFLDREHRKWGGIHGTASLQLKAKEHIFHRSYTRLFTPRQRVQRKVALVPAYVSSTCFVGSDPLRRTDGKIWQCRREALPGETMCASHSKYHREPRAGDSPKPKKNILQHKLKAKSVDDKKKLGSRFAENRAARAEKASKVARIAVEGEAMGRELRPRPVQETADTPTAPPDEINLGKWNILQYKADHPLWQDINFAPNGYPADAEPR